MWLPEVVLKRGLGGTWTLCHLASVYRARMNDHAVEMLERALAGDSSCEGTTVVERLRSRGLVADGPFQAIPRRDETPLETVEVEVTARCNLACKHCFVPARAADMPRAIFERVVVEAIAAGAVHVVLNGGEPLCSEQALDFVEIARSAALKVTLFTNATQVQASTARRLAALGVARVNVSLDGFEAEHDALRGRRAFRRTVFGIRRLVRAGVPTYVTTVVHPGNLRVIEALRTYCLGRLGVAGVRLAPIAPLGRAASESGLTFASQPVPAILRDSMRKRSEPRAKPPLWPCAAGVTQLFVAASGAVYPCRYFEPLVKPLGHVERDRLADLAREATQHLPVLASFDAEGPLACRTCPSVGTCRGGCRARAWLLGGHAQAADPVSCALYV